MSQSTPPAVPPRAGAAALSPEEKKRLLAEMLRKKAAGPRTYPLSFTQQRLWFLAQLEPGSTAFHVPLAQHVEGPLDVPALERALSEVVRRHEALRTRFGTGSDGEPVQVAEPPFAVTLPVHDLTHLPDETARRVAVMEHARELSGRPMDLETAPLFRAELLRLAPDQHALVMVLHHAITDGWSQKILVDEMLASYAAAVRGEPSPLPPVALQYGDFAAWQRKHLTDERLEGHLRYWSEALSGAPPLLEIPTDRPRPPVQGHESDSLMCLLSSDVRAELDRMARGEGASLFMAYLAAYAAVLGRWSGQETVVVGTPVLGRDRPELEAVMGFFANTLALPIHLDGDPSFRELLGRVRQSLLGAFSHQELPFDRVVEEVATERSLAYAPVYQVLFAYTNLMGAKPPADAGAGAPGAEVAGLRIFGIGAEHSAAQADLALNLGDAVDGVGVSADFRTELFGRETVLELIRQFDAVLHEAAADPDRPLSAVSMLDDERRAAVMALAPGRAAERPRATLHGLFAERAARAPDAPAVVFGERTVTYAELDRRAARVAARLRALGAGPEARVALCVERGPEALAGILGVLKAGAAYVPVDPAYPAERRAWVLRDADARVLVTQRSLAAELAADGVELLVLEDVVEDEAGVGAAVPAPEVGPDALAYVIYTSGSTGLPKGVMVPHRAAVNFALSEVEETGVGPADRVLQFGSLSFDSSVLDWTLALLSGACLVMGTREEVMPGPDLSRLAREKGVTVAALTPSSLAVMPAGSLETVRTLFVGGEACPPELAARWAAPGRRLVNAYGPTETTVLATQQEVAPGPERPGIGQALPNARAYVLDAALHVVPLGVPGELCIGGAGVARGYLGRPALTAERFVPDPFSPVPGARMYRTGDRVRRRVAGELEFLGRLDEQVKVRGFRIEPGEVEAVLRRHPAVAEAAVVAREDEPGERYLAAYVVGRDGAAPGADELREHLRAALPEHMVPAAFVALSELPRTRSHKVDRRALPRPDRAAAAAEHVEPRTATEAAVAGIFAEVLGLERAGATDHFFERGGHSLLATRVVSRLRSVLEVELPLRALFESPTVAALAARVDAESGAMSTAAEAPPLVPVAREGAVPLSFAQERLWFVERLADVVTTYTVPAVWPVPGADAALLERTLAEVVRRHEALRTVFREEEGGPVQVVRPADGFALRVVEAGSPADAERVIGEELSRRFDLEAGPLFRATLVRMGEEQVLVLAMHHIVSDGWSMNVLQREVETIYRALERGEESPLAPLPVQYADFALWQRAWLAGEVLEEQLAYWRAQLSGAPAMLELPTDRPRPPVQTFHGSVVPVSLPKEVGEKLSRLALAEGATPFMALLAAWSALLSRHAGQEDVVVGSPIAGRNRTEVEGLVGFFVNNLVLRTDLSGNPSFRELVRRSREVTLGAYAHQDVPFEKLVESVGVERSLSHTPLFQVMFVLQNTGEGPAGAPVADGDDGAEPDEDVDGGHRTAKFDLTLNLAETPQGGLVGSIEFNTDLFDRATVRRMARHFRALAAALAEAPDAPVAAAEMLPGDEREKVGAFGGIGVQVEPPAQPVHRLVEERVDAAPHAVALAFGGEEVTYAELDARANRLARHLRELGVGAEVPVALSLPRGPEMVVALLAVLKAGGAYVPVDPAYPRERRAWMLEDSGAPVLVTLSSLVDDLPATGARRVLLDADADRIAAHDPTRVAVYVSPESLAYVIYTSGSTGRPKGVAVAHRGVAHLAREQARTFEIGPDSRVLQFASFSFDAAVSEVVTTLARGACLVLAPQEELMPGPGLARVLREGAVTVATLPPSVLASMEETDFPALATLVSAGEALPREVARRWVAGRRLVNGYGPTETTVCATMGLVHPDDARPGIGRPMAGMHVLVLSAAGRPAGVGVPGEIHVGGIGVARGYLGRPGLTAERFVPDAFSGRPGARLYRTGDRGRWREDGTLEFLGRVDEQVKVRGFRVEPGEVEAALSALEGVREAAVVAREDVPGDRYLAAYVVAEDGAALDGGALRARLGERLPQHMVPSVVVVLEALPLTPNGKVDRRALPRPDRTAAEHVEPRTATEAAVAGIFAEVLGLERAGATDHFFERGGHSLLATRVVSRLRSVLGVELPLRALFESPTVAALAARVDAESGTRSAAAEAPPLVPMAREGAVPLSFAQERLWFVERLADVGTTYTVPAVWPVPGADAALLERTLAEVVRRHEALRTVFREEEGGAVQVVQPADGFALRVVEAGSPADAERVVGEELSRRFDLEAGPLFRATLVRIGGGEEQLLVLAMHHIVSDGWSMNVLQREVETIYRALERGEESPLPPLPVQYADYAIWQRNWLVGEVLEEQLAYWRAQLSGAPAMLELPTDRPRPAVQTYNGSVVPVSVAPAVGERLSKLALAEGATPFMALLAAWSALLSRHAGQEDVVVGSPIAGRNRTEVEGLVGFFVNNLVLRTDLSGDPSFRELVRRSREVTLGAYAHQDVPFEKLVEELKVERSLSHTPLFQVMLVLQNTGDASAAAPSGDAGPAQEDEDAGGAHQTARFDLTLNLAETLQGGLAGSIEFNTDLFDRATVRRMARQFRQVLAQVAEHPDAPVSAIALGEADERRVLVSEWSGRATDYERDASLPALFAARAAQSPSSIAVSADDATLTYAELDARANRLARRLRALGVREGTRVGLSVERSAEMVVAILAILKAGGAYVPLDASYPAVRLGWMLEDAEVPVLVVGSEVPQALSGFSGTVLSLAASRDAIDGESADALTDVTVDGGSLAYVMFTSGSTGRPKGVAVPHRAVARLVRGTDFARFGADEVFLQLAPVAFDASTLEIWGALLNGARLSVFPPEAPTLEALGDAIQRHGVTTLWLTAGLFRQMVEQNIDGLRGVRQLLAGGDVLPVAHCRRVLEALPGTTLINGYGPTENTTFTACHTVRGEDLERASIPIGKPIANTRVYVLDERMQPVPVGVPGELYAGGDGVALGYVGRPELTAERFVPDPFSDDAEARLYRTGDRVRWLADGTLEFLGRLDQQVKVRGFRIETGEIESALSEHPGVLEAVVVPGDDPAGGLRLIAYVVSKEITSKNGASADAGTTDSVDADALRGWLRGRLPEYMVPSAFVTLDAIPLTANGKVDRRALPEPEAGDAGRGYIAPATPTEEALAAIWADVLKRERVGAEDGFFELGGHSLLATRVVSRVRQEFEVELPLRALFEAPTVRALADRIDGLRASGSSAAQTAPPIVPVPHEAPMPLSFAQERLWFVERVANVGATYNVPSVHPVPHADPVVLERTLAEIVRRHEALRTTFREEGGRPVQVIHPAGGFRLRVEDLSSLAEAERHEEAGRIVSEEYGRPFDLETGPLFRATLVRGGPGEQLLVVNMHHVVSDGWSMGVFQRELEAIYHAFERGEPSPLPELPVQYADYAVWQRDWLQGDVLDAQLAYWKAQLAGAPAMLELPSDRPRPPVQTFLGASRTVLLPAALRDRLSSLAREEGGTLFMALLAGWSALLGRWSGQDDVVVGSTVAGRTRQETEALIGFFVNNLVLRSDLSGDPSFRDLLRRSRETTLGAYAHQDVPFEKLVEEMGVERSLSHSPLFQVVLNVLTAETGAMGGAAAAEADGVEGQNEHAKYDLTLTISDTEAGLSANLNYNADLFDAGTIRRMLDHLRALLERAAARPDAPLSRVSVLSDEERGLVLDEWTRTTRPEYRRDLCIHRFFEAQAASAPERTALVFGDERITYGELNGRANQLARHLRTLGVGPDRLVGVCMPRTPEMVVSLLAVLKAGGAYLPVDLAYPPERIGWMLEDAQAPVVLTHSALAERIPLQGPAVAVPVDAEAARIATYPSTDLEDVPVGPANLAYCIYTSGSTGRPKGVAIEHRNTAVLLQWLRDEVPDEERKSVLGATSISFDVSVAEIFGTLGWGGTLVLVENALSLAELPAGVEVTYASMVPSAAAELLRMRAIPSSLATLLLGGEPVPASLARGLHELGTLSRLGNGYGPTEETTYSTVAWLPPGAGKVTVGRPVANTRAYVLDRHLAPVPVGVPGELYLAGDGVTRGYFNRPALTAERYVPDPFSAEGGGRMYRVGDLVRYLPSGEIEYLGRIDQQVKVRGFRIETGEIEAALTSLDGVREAAVVAREVAEGDRRLVAYVVADEGAEVDASALRMHLAGRLPEYMVPAAVVPLDALPLTPNGKVDRRALPAPDWSGVGGEHVGPRDEVEAQLVAIWEEVLGVSPIGVHDHFFALGGHSLLAVRMTTLVRERMGRELPLASLFRGDTVEVLAAELRGETSTAAELLVPVQPEGDRTPLFLVHGAAGAVLRFMGLGRAIGADQPVYALRARGLEPGEEPAGSIEEMAAAYVEAIRRERPQGPYHVGGWSSGCAVAMEVARQLRAAGEEVPLLLLLDGSSPTLDAKHAGQSDLELLTQVAVELGRPLPPEATAELKKLEGEDRLQRALEWINAAGAVLPAGDTARLRRLVDVLRASLRVWTAYRPAPYDGPALLLQAYDRLAAEMAVNPYTADFRLAWASVLPQMRGEVVPGGHYAMLEGENAAALAERIRAAL